MEDGAIGLPCEHRTCIDPQNTCENTGVCVGGGVDVYNPSNGEAETGQPLGFTDSQSTQPRRDPVSNEVSDVAEDDFRGCSQAPTHILALCMHTHIHTLCLSKSKNK